MALTLHYHPLSSFCWKALIALYENETPFRPHIVDLGDAKAAAAFKAIWPIGKFPVLRDDARDQTVPESSVIIEYLGQHYPGKSRLIPADPELALEVRLADRVYDLYVHDRMQRIVGDRLRPEGKRDPHGVELARAQLTHRPRHDRGEDGVADLGCGRNLHHGRLRRGSGPVLRRQGDAVRRYAPEHGGLSRPPHAAPVVCARARGGEALFRDVPRLARPAQSALSARVATG